MNHPASASDQNSTSPLSAASEKSQSHSLSLRLRLLGVMSCVLLILCGIAGYSIWGTQKQSKGSEDAIRRIKDSKTAIQVKLDTVAVYQTYADTIINLKTDAKDFNDASAELSASIAKLREIVDTEAEIELTKRLSEKQKEISVLYSEKVCPRVGLLMATNDPVERDRLMGELRDIDDACDKLVQNLMKNAESCATSLENESVLAQAGSQATARSVTNWMLALTALAIVSGAALALLFSAYLSKQLSLLASRLSTGANQTASAAAQVSSASQSLAEGATEQAASLEETSASLEEMAGTTRRNAENTQQASVLATQARSVAEQGVRDMQSLSEAMVESKRSSDAIGAIIKTIDEISFQTNILALNAAVEAARAGEAGAGFAVVAEEVRNLAQRAASAARETSGLIEGSAAKTAQGVELNQHVAKVLQDIVDNVRKVDSLVAEVAGASREQSQGIEQLNTAVGQMDKITQGNAAHSEESAAAAQQLDAQALNTLEIVKSLVVLVEGSSAGKA